MTMMTMIRFAVLCALCSCSLAETDTCLRVTPKLVIFSRLPWYQGTVIGPPGTKSMGGGRVSLVIAGPEKDRFHGTDAMEESDVTTAYSGSLREKFNTEITSRLAKKTSRLTLLERSIPVVEVPGAERSMLRWVSMVEHPVSRASRAFHGTAAELKKCIKKNGVKACVPCESMTLWFCGEGCKTVNRGVAALIRAKLRLSRDFAFVGVRERLRDSNLVMKEVLSGFFEGNRGPNLSQMIGYELGGSPKVEDIDAWTQAEIEKANPLDAELYAHAVAHLEQALFTCTGRDSAFFLGGAVAPSFRPYEPTVSTAFVADAGVCIKKTEKTGFEWQRSGRFDNSHQCFPSVIFVGARTVGVTLLSKLLTKHKHVHGPPIDRQAFFGTSLSRTHAGFLDYAMVPDFQLRRREKHEGHITVEASTEYSVRPNALEEIRSLLPRARVVFVLQEPVQRAYDEFCEMEKERRVFQREAMIFICYEPETMQTCNARGSELGRGYPLAQAFGEYTRQLLFQAWDRTSSNLRTALNDSLPADFDGLGYNENILSKSIYAPQVQRILTLFEPSRRHFVVYERLTNEDDALEEMNSLLKFLQIPTQPIFTAEGIIDAANDVTATLLPRHPPLTKTTRTFLEVFFAVDIQILKMMLPKLKIPWGGESSI